MRSLQLLLACLLLAWTRARPVPVGLDTGTTWTRLAHFNPASAEGIDFVVSDQGDRRFPTVVGFSEDDTIYGDEADSLSQRRPERTVPHLPRLLDYAYGGEFFTSYKTDFPHVPLTDLPRGDIALDAGWDHKPSIAELYARFLRFFVFQQASSQLSFTGYIAGDPLSIVLVYPLGTAVPYHEMLQQVVRAAGGDVHKTISSAAAATTDWAIRMLQAGEEAQLVIVDVGTLLTTAAVMSAAKSADGKITIKALQWARDDQFGGYRVDQALASFLKKKVENGRSVTWTAKRESRILRAAHDLKEALSASAQAEVHLEELLPDWDFKLVVSREDADTACEALYDAFAVFNPLRQLKMDRLIGKNVKTVELIGGASRIPKVRSILARQEITLAYHLSPDESVAWGAAEFGRLLVADQVDLTDALTPSPFMDQLRPFPPVGVAQLAEHIANEAKREEQKRRRTEARAALESELAEAREEGLGGDESLRMVSEWLDDVAPSMAVEEFAAKRVAISQLRKANGQKEEL